jgi:hypothetical protein
MGSRAGLVAVMLIVALAACSTTEPRPVPTVTVTKTVTAPRPPLTDQQASQQATRFLRSLWSENYQGVRECTRYARTMLHAALDWNLHNLSRGRDHYMAANCTNVGKPYPIAFKGA